MLLLLRCFSWHILPSVDDHANGDVETDGDAGVDAADDQAGGVD